MVDIHTYLTHDKTIKAKDNVLIKQITIIMTNESKICLKNGELISSNDVILQKMSTQGKKT